MFQWKSLCEFSHFKLRTVWRRAGSTMNVKWSSLNKSLASSIMFCRTRSRLLLVEAAIRFQMGAKFCSHRGTNRRRSRSSLCSWPRNLSIVWFFSVKRRFSSSMWFCCCIVVKDAICWAIWFCWRIARPWFNSGKCFWITSSLLLRVWHFWVETIGWWVLHARWLTESVW